jgi:integrase
LAKILTAAAIKKFRPSGKRRRIPDGGMRSLFFVIESTGRRRWEMRFRTPTGRIGKLTLGPLHIGEETVGPPVIGMPLTLQGARQLAAEVHRERALGRDVVADHQARRRRQRVEAGQRGATNFGVCVREFIVDHKVKKWGTRPRRWRETARTLGLAYLPNSDPATTEPDVVKGGFADIWRDRPVAEIDDHLIFETVRAVGKQGIPGLGRRNGGNSDARMRSMYAALSGLFGWLKRQRRTTHNPCAEVERPGPPPARTRVLDDSEIRWYWRSCDAVGEPFATIFRLLMLTGQRLNEVAGLRRSELHGDMWYIPSHRTKNHRPHQIVLPRLARSLIAVVPDDQEIIFSTNGGTPPSGWSRATARLRTGMLQIAREEAKATGRDPDIVTLAPFRLHDVRRSVASKMQKINIPTAVIERALNHVSGSFAGITGTYQVDPMSEQTRDAFERWTTHLQGLVSDKPTNVTALRRG